MNVSKLSEELKKKYLEEFKKKWNDYAKVQRDSELNIRYKELAFSKEIRSNAIDLTLIGVIGGTFQQKRSVTVSDFYIGKYEVTQAQYKVVMGKNPSRFKGNNNPVENVNWYEVVEFCNKLSEMDGLKKCYSGSGNNTQCDFNASGYRLPTEAEWEYASRGGLSSAHYEYSGSNDVGEVAEYEGNNNKSTKLVGYKKPNELGIYDMSGNVWEWCWDWYGAYSSSSQTNPTGVNSGLFRVIRGGSWYFRAKYCRVANRDFNKPSSSLNHYGFRVVSQP